MIPVHLNGMNAVKAHFAWWDKVVEMKKQER